MNVTLYDILRKVGNRDIIIRMLDGTIEYKGDREGVPFDILQFEVRGLFVTDGKLDITIQHLNYKW